MNAMIKEVSVRFAIGLVLLVPLAAGLAACNTTAGAGKDIAATGNAVTNAANSAK